MLLLPVSKDVPPTHWQCSKCNRQITIQERNEVFTATLQTIRDEYMIHITYNRQYNQWYIWSLEWPGETRIGATRKKITNAERNEIIDILLNSLEDTLKIKVESAKDFFVEN